MDRCTPTRGTPARGLALQGIRTCHPSSICSITFIRCSVLRLVQVSPTLLMTLSFAARPRRRLCLVPACPGASEQGLGDSLAMEGLAAVGSAVGSAAAGSAAVHHLS